MTIGALSDRLRSVREKLWVAVWIEFVEFVMAGPFLVYSVSGSLFRILS